MTKIFSAAAGIVLISLLAWSSLAAAAPPTKGTPSPRTVATATHAPTRTPVPRNTATATPVPSVVEVSPTNNAPDLGVDAAAAAAPVNPGVMTSRIFVFNLDSSTARVGINFYNPDGTSAGVISPFTIPSNGAVAKTLPSTIKRPFSGSAVVSSDKNVQAFVTDSNGNNTARDEYGGTLLTDTSLILPFVRHLGVNTQNSIIAIQNTGNAPADITLNLYNQDGTAGPSKVATSVAPLASAYFNTNDIFPSGTFTGTAKISATGGVALAGSEQTRYLKDTASFRALTSSDDGTTLAVAFVERRRTTTGTPTSWSEIYVRNDGTSPTDITAKFYSANGVLMGGVTTTRMQVPPDGMAQFLTSAPEFKSLTQTSSYFKGWAAITSGGQPISLYSLEAQSSGARLFSANGITASGAKFACGDTFRYNSPSQMSTINIVNPNTGSASVTIKLYKSNGTSGGTKKVTVGANKQVSVSLSDASFSAAGSSFEGMAVVTSTGASVFASVYTPYGGGGVTSYNCALLP